MISSPQRSLRTQVPFITLPYCYHHWLLEETGVQENQDWTELQTIEADFKRQSYRNRGKETSVKNWAQT